MYNSNLSTQDVKNVRKLLLPSSTEEKVLNYLSLHGDNPKSRPSNSPLILVGYVVVAILTAFGMSLIGKSIFGNDIFNTWLSPTLQNSLQNIFVFVFWASIALLIVTIICFYVLSAAKKIEFISLKCIYKIVKKNYFNKVFGYICTISLIGGFILSGYWISLIFYLIVNFANIAIKAKEKEEFKKAIEELDQTKTPIDAYFQMNRLQRSTFW